MFEDIKKNKIKSGFIIFVFLFMISLIIYYICIMLEFDGPAAVIIAMLFSFITTFASYYNSDKIILASCKAKPATEEENRKLVHILDALMISSGLSHRPGLYVINDPQPNAFATGRNPEHSIICVTTGLLEKMEYYELEGVLAHEMGHIKNYDILLTSVVTVLVGFLVMVSDIFSRTLFYRGARRSRDKDSSLSIILMFIGLVLLILSPILGVIMQMALSRQREYLADATAAEITRNPQGLISALRKLDSDPNELQNANKATANLFIVTPFRKNNGKKKTGLFDTHPAISDRIERLQNIK